MSKIKINEADKAKTLAVLYNNSKAQGMGWLHFEDEDMTEDEAKKWLKQTTYFDYLKGRVMKLDLSTNEVETWLYDRDNGEGAVISALKRNNIEFKEVK